MLEKLITKYQQKRDKSLMPRNTQVKHNHHQLLSNHSIHTESEGLSEGLPSGIKLILSSKLSIKNLKAIKF